MSTQKLKRKVLDLKHNNNQWHDLFFIRLLYGLLFSFILFIPFLIFSEIFFKDHSDILPLILSGAFLTIFMYLSWDKIKKISMHVKELNKTDIIFTSDDIEINPNLIDVHMKSPLLNPSLEAVHENVMNSKMVKINWNDIDIVERVHKRSTHGSSAHSYIYRFILTTTINGDKELILNRKFFMGQELKFEKLFLRYAGKAVVKRSKTILEGHGQTRTILLMVIMVIFISYIAHLAGYDVFNIIKALRTK